MLLDQLKKDHEVFHVFGIYILYIFIMEFFKRFFFFLKLDGE